MPALKPAGLDFLAQAPTISHADVTIGRSPADVWAALTDTAGWPQWFAGMRAARATSDGGGVGGTRFIDLGLLRADEEFVAWEPERRFAFTVVRTNVPLARRWVEQVELAPAPTDDGRDGTRMRYTGAVDLLPLNKPFASVFARQTSRAWARSFANLDAA